MTMLQLHLKLLLPISGIIHAVFVPAEANRYTLQTLSLHLEGPSVSQ